ncbi:MAG: hypothetical protein CMJ64_03725 [Planctomycetaceae bacterium]|nr:hypothetical protein [Planctomycetaceae bacterium]
MTDDRPQSSADTSPRSHDRYTRRSFLQAGVVAAGGALVATPTTFAERDPARRPKVAAIFTVCHHRSHAHVILENFLETYLFNGKETDPGVDVVSFYADQTPGGDMSAEVGQRYKIPIFKTIDEALCVGGKELAVDAVLSIGEHGSYPVNELGQRQYPRKRFFDEIVSVMRRSNRFVPMFNDKHLSYRWDEAKAMYDEAKALGIPLMAGSSVPLAQRRPTLEFPRHAEFEEVVSIHGGPLESYDFHALEVLQSLIESRKGGETGVSSVELLSGDAVWKTADDGRWSRDLADAAMTAELGKPLTTLKAIEGEAAYEPHCILLKYKDGLRATILKIGRDSTRWNVACRLKREPDIKATSFYVGPWENRNLFKALSHAIQHHFIHGKAPYAVERTLLVTGVLESAMRSRKEAGKPIQTPHLRFGYRSPDFTAMREMGASWKIITEDIPEPRGINPLGR